MKTKSVNRLKQTWGIIILMFVALYACNQHTDEEYNVLEKQKVTADGITKEQATDLIEKDSVINNFLSSFNEIQSNLDEIKRKEEVITVSKIAGAEQLNANKDQIVNDINAIKDLMQSNKNRIASLQQKVKNANFKSEALQKLIDRLTNDVKLKDEQIAELQSKLENANVAFKDLLGQYDQKTQELDQATDKMNTVYYAYGTSKELKTNGVTSKSGGFIGLGKSTTLATDFNKNYFTKSNTKDLKTIALNAKKAKVLSSHPSSSYKLNAKDKKIENLEITNVDEFWSASKYLVIEIEN